MLSFTQGLRCWPQPPPKSCGAAAPLALVQVSHVFADPIQRWQLAEALDLEPFQAALILCDER